jgi:hypothetical protein
MAGRQLLPPLVRTVIVEVVHVLADDSQRVSLVVDQNMVGALFAQAAAQRSMKQFARGVRGGILTTVMPSAAKT